jgi:hypothetical protein
MERMVCRQDFLARTRERAPADPTNAAPWFVERTTSSRSQPKNAKTRGCELPDIVD